MQIIRKATYPATRWNNGGGITHEIIRVPPVGGSFRWRLSIAQIDASGPFSDFAGYHRRMVLLRGCGVRLTFDGAPPAALLAVGDMAEFDGALKTDCCLVAGACTDLNLMVDKSMGVSARVERLRSPHVLPASRRAITLALGITCGLSVTCDGKPAVRLDPWDLAVLPPTGAGAVTSTADPGAQSLVFFATLDDNFG